MEQDPYFHQGVHFILVVDLPKEFVQAISSTLISYLQASFGPMLVKPDPCLRYDLFSIDLPQVLLDHSIIRNRER